jgi:hypothetical protein
MACALPSVGASKHSFQGRLFSRSFFYPQPGTVHQTAGFAKPKGKSMSVNTKNWQELKKPNSLEIKDGGDRQRKVTFVAEPLERGFGLTLGNALRRVLLSSLQGAAITSIKIENVLHEFLTQPSYWISSHT